MPKKKNLAKDATPEVREKRAQGHERTLGPAGRASLSRRANTAAGLNQVGNTQADRAKAHTDTKAKEGVSARTLAFEAQAGRPGAFQTSKGGSIQNVNDNDLPSTMRRSKKK